MVGDYTLQARLGEGGMGIVHLARHRDGRRAALKVLRPHIVGDDEARARLAREVDSLSRVRSPWVAEIIDADPWGETPYVVTRYVPGASLHDLVVDEGAIDGDDLWWLAGCLAEGVAAVHAAGVLHRDVKPANVLMEGRTPILIDFGLARVAEDPRLTQTGWLLGTPGYLAPEILYGDTPTPAADVHAWAATVAWAATGRNPYGRGPSTAIMDRTRRGEHDLSGMTGPLADVVDAALDPDPLARPTLPEILAWLRPFTTDPDQPAASPPIALSLLRSRAPEHTRVLPAERAVPDERAEAAVAQWEGDWDRAAVAPQRTGFLERLRRGCLVALGCVVIGAATAAAPLVTALVAVVSVWLLRSGSLTAAAARERRTLLGPKWYDAPRAALTTPWHLLRGTVGTVLLVLSAACLALVGGVFGYALDLDMATMLFLAGSLGGATLWLGPGAGRVRSPASGVVRPVARGTRSWLIGSIALLVAAGALGVLVGIGGTAWAPLTGPPF